MSLMVTKAVAFVNAADMAIVMPMMLYLSSQSVAIDIGRRNEIDIQI
jgi:Mn2+/Fe2+ NRAMP family transporter